MSPRDPRFEVRWDNEDAVTVQASDAGTAMNDLKIEVHELGDHAASPAISTLEQVAPGRYRGTISPTTSARLFALHVGGQTIDLHASAGGSMPEFRAIGVDRETLEGLAHRTGGRVIDRNEITGPADPEAACEQVARGAAADCRAALDPRRVSSPVPLARFAVRG